MKWKEIKNWKYGDGDCRQSSHVMPCPFWKTMNIGEWKWSWWEAGAGEMNQPMKGMVDVAFGWHGIKWKAIWIVVRNSREVTWKCIGIVKQNLKQTGISSAFLNEGFWAMKQTGFRNSHSSRLLYATFSDAFLKAFSSSHFVASRDWQDVFAWDKLLSLLGIGTFLSKKAAFAHNVR